LRRRGSSCADERARESSQQPTRETATGGATRVVLEYGWVTRPVYALPELMFGQLH
jgi:hypothetical protein